MSTAGVPPGQSPIEDLESTIDKIVGSSGVLGKEAPGCCIGVSWTGKRVVRAYGHAQVDPPLPAVAATPFCIGSVTKPFTAAAVLHLVETVGLDLRSPVRAWLAELTGEAGRAPLWSLLNHTSGLSHTLDHRMRADAWPESTDEALRQLGQAPCSAAPGTTWSYSNTGYFLLALVVERVSGTSLYEYTRRHVLDRADLAATWFADDRQLPSLRAVGHTRTDRGLGTVDVVFSGAAFGSGDLWSSAGDLLTWSGALATGRVLSTDTFQQMITPICSAAPAYGYGMFVAELQGHREISHDGNSGGFSTQLASYPDDHLTVAVLLNGSRHVAERIEKRITRKILRLPEAMPLDLATLPEEMSALVGAYDLGDRQAQVFLDHERLMVRSPGGSVSRLMSQGGSEFVSEDDPALQMSFTPCPGGGFSLRVSRSGTFVASAVRTCDDRMPSSLPSCE
jgi:D-alanyl-D-alanine carboxypeptidase